MGRGSIIVVRKRFFVVSMLVAAAKSVGPVDALPIGMLLLQVGAPLGFVGGKAVVYRALYLRLIGAIILTINFSRNR